MDDLILEVELSGSRRRNRIEPDLAQARLPAALGRVGIPLNTRCGGRGLCDGCTVELLSGRLAHISTGRAVEASGRPVRLKACQYRLDGRGHVLLHIPARSQLAYQPQIVTDYRINIPRAHDPLFQRVKLRREPSRAAAWTPAELVRAALAAREDDRPVEAGAALCGIESDEVVANLEYRPDRWLISAVATADRDALLGAAVDVGTTTVALLLLDLRTGRILSRQAQFNQQMTLGDDVITRITLCMHDAGMVRRLQEAVARRTVAPMLRAALGEAGAPPREVRCIVVAGNTTMLHLLAGADPSSLGVVPFTPVFTGHRVLSAGEVFGPDCPDVCPPDVAVHLLPSASAYVGADLSAGMIATGLHYDDGPCLLVDAGTNGEIILKHRGRLLGCATAAGPAFEGAGLACGMRAGDGAITAISLRASPFAVEARWAGEDRAVPPAGICGSAYVDFLAEGRRIGLLTPTGRFDLSALGADGGHLVAIDGAGPALRIVGEDLGRIFITQADVAKLLAAKAAIAAGILTLLARAGLSPADVRKVYLAGGFGTHMSAASAVACGLLPGFSPAQVEPVGNTSLAGAMLALLDSGIAAELSQAAGEVEIVELNLDGGFEDRYIDAMCLP